MRGNQQDMLIASLYTYILYVYMGTAYIVLQGTLDLSCTMAAVLVAFAFHGFPTGIGSKFEDLQHLILHAEVVFLSCFSFFTL